MNGSDREHSLPPVPPSGGAESSETSDSRDIPLTCLIAGAIAAVIEIFYRLGGSLFDEPRAFLVALSVAVTLQAGVGLAWGLIVRGAALVSSFCRSRSARVLLVAGLLAVAAWPYANHARVGIGMAGAAAIAWLLRSAAPLHTVQMIAYAGMLWWLSPLFTGYAMLRVFSDAQVSVIFHASLAAMFVVAWMIGPALHARRGGPIVGVLRGAAGVVAAALLNVVSSVFLVRLWGFHTMEYLQMTLFVIKISLLCFVARALLNRIAPLVRENYRTANLVALLAVLVGFVISAYVTVPDNARARSYLSQVPDTSLTMNGIAAVLDRDRDDYASVFGFGDCDDTNPVINPTAVDWLGNGIDENCFGGDLKSVAHSYYGRTVDLQDPPPVADGSRRRRVVYLVIVDTLRADAVDYDVTSPSSPQLARIAAAGVRYERAYSQSNNTLEAFPFLLHVGFRNPPRFHEPWSLPFLFRKSGVLSAGVYQSSTNWWHNELDRVLLGFDRQSYPDKRVLNRSEQETVREALAQLEVAPERDLFVLVHFEALHNFFTDIMEGGRMIYEGLNVSELAALWDVQATARTARERYAKVLTRVDRAVGELFDGVRRAESTSDVLFIVTSDHGEEFLEHNGLFHMSTLYEELVRVPLIVYATGTAPRIEQVPVGTYRVPATILRWLGFSGRFLDDMNLLAAPVNQTEIFGYFSYKAEWVYRTFMILQGPYKLTYDTGQGTAELYDLEKDPGEKNNLLLAAHDGDLAQQLFAQMDTLLFYMNYGDIAYRKAVAAARARSSGERDR